MQARQIRLSIDSRLEDVFLIGLAVNRICAHLPFSEIEAYQAEVCVVEAANNAVKHAYKGEAGRPVEVAIRLLHDRVLFEIVDRGESMVWTGARADAVDFDPTVIENLPTSGLGLHIIEDVMDSVEYEQRDGANVLSMAKCFESRTVSC